MTEPEVVNASTRPRRSLAQVFARQWASFTVCLAGVFVAGTVLLLFVLEDSFIDRRLRESATAVLDANQPLTLPTGMTAVAGAQIPDDIAVRMQSLRAGAIREFRRADGRYVHVLQARDASGVPFLLLYDVTDELTVTAALARYTPYLLMMLLTLAVLSHLLARGFVRHTAQRAQQLVTLVGEAASPQALRAHAANEPLRELAELASLLADGWEQRLAALRQEQETLAFLAHELRTPLQSARTSLALMQGGQTHAAVLGRMQRAIDRLVRASNSVLWLASDADPSAQLTALAPLIEDLVSEFTPLAAARGQTLHGSVDPDVTWRGPQEVLVAVLGNLMLNAIQHGGAGPINVSGNPDAISVDNPAGTPAGSPDSAGFGLGLRIVERLCQRCGWQIERIDHEGRVSHRIVADVRTAG